ncbi:MAG: MGMT family protein [Longimicrobiales bacterium]|nr:MGMT family protein [Longimicrobiales bacterium]
MSDFTARVHDAVRSVPSGRVVSYGAIAALAGSPGAARAVGAVLRALPDSADVPWWRVVGARGELSIPRAGHGRVLQRRLLEEEGVEVGEDGAVDMGRRAWPASEGLADDD